MSVQYAAVKWNRNKRVYDGVIVVSVVCYVAFFYLGSKLLFPGTHGISDEVVLIRAFGTCAIIMLHIVLCIGPLARFDRRFLPALFNRRHLGVATFLMGLAHGALATGYYHGFGKLNPIVSLLSTNTNYMSITGFPFESLGLTALIILFVMAATSHDFWQRNLSPSAWKWLHMLVYPAYGLLVMHVVLGALQSERNVIYAVLVVAGAMTVIGLHLATAYRELHRDREFIAGRSEWIDVGSVAEIPDSRAKVVGIAGQERVAVFRHGNCISAVTNVCAHQRGPLGEGKIVDGCITCPWHGWQYRPKDGQSPPPFREKIATYPVRLQGRRIELKLQAMPPGTPFEPARIAE